MAYNIELNKTKPNKFFLIRFTLLLSLLFYGCLHSAHPKEDKNIHEGDIIFLSSNSPRAGAIKIASRSPYSHVGVVIQTKKGLKVFEAVQPVRFTSIDKFIARGNLVLIKRLKDNTLVTEKSARKFRKLAASWVGKNYDGTYRWSDSRMYCSELVWKLYDRAFDIQLVPLRRLEQYSLKSPVVRTALRKVYGKKIPYKQTVIAPGDLANSEYLRRVDL